MIFLYFLCGLYFLGMLFILIYSLAQGHLLFHFLKAQRSWGKIAKKNSEGLAKRHRSATGL